MKISHRVEDIEDIDNNVNADGDEDNLDVHTESGNLYYENGDKGENIEDIDDDVNDDADEDIDDNVSDDADEDMSDDVDLDVHPESGHHSIASTEAPLGKLSLVEKSKTFTTFFVIM